MVNDDRYAIRYKLDFDWTWQNKGWTKNDINDGEYGLADALMLVSVLRDNPEFDPDKGAKSFLWTGIDGRGEKVEYPDRECFQLVAHMCSELRKSPNLTKWQRDLCEFFFEGTKTAILAGRGIKDVRE